MQSQLKELLLKIGLTEPETLIYLDLLQKPSLNKWSLIQRTGLNKNKVYRACEHLKELNLIEKNSFGIHSKPLDNLLYYINKQKTETENLALELKSFIPFTKIPSESISDINIATKSQDILSSYQMMSELNYDTCLDFGDLENYVDVLGGLEPVFKFRANRFKQNAKNKAICTTIGPYTSCMMRKEDLKRFKSNIKNLSIEYKGKWIIFSDTNNYVMFNDFSDLQKPTSVVINSKHIADTQRFLFDQFLNNSLNFS